MDIRSHIVGALSRRRRRVHPQRGAYPSPPLRSRARVPPPPYPPPPLTPPPGERVLMLSDLDGPLELLAMVATLEFMSPPVPRPSIPLPEFVLESDLSQCSICQEEMKRGETIRWLPCQETRNHAFHKECIDPWIKDHSSCPTCRGTW